MKRVGPHPSRVEEVGLREKLEKVLYIRKIEYLQELFSAELVVGTTTKLSWNKALGTRRARSGHAFSLSSCDRLKTDCD